LPELAIKLIDCLGALVQQIFQSTGLGLFGFQFAPQLQDRHLQLVLLSLQIAEGCGLPGHGERSELKAG
jgi:hypothetical protein